MTTCLYVSQIPAPHPHVLTKVFATLHRQIVCTWNCFSSNYRTSLRKKQGRQVFAKRYFSKFVYFYVAGCRQLLARYIRLLLTVSVSPIKNSFHLRIESWGFQDQILY